ncbi:hypothetical protein TNCV_3916331 [Trichonephila clavipes]|nr:hypothetical protein TNCV_3916331 [Trichonephila clavipes]
MFAVPSGGSFAFPLAGVSLLLSIGWWYLSPRRDTAVGSVLQISGFTRWILALDVLEGSAVPDDRRTLTLRAFGSGQGIGLCSSI